MNKYEKQENEIRLLKEQLSSLEQNIIEKTSETILNFVEAMPAFLTKYVEEVATSQAAVTIELGKEKINEIKRQIPSFVNVEEINILSKKFLVDIRAQHNNEYYVKNFFSNLTAKILLQCIDMLKKSKYSIHVRSEPRDFDSISFNLFHDEQVKLNNFINENMIKLNIIIKLRDNFRELDYKISSAEKNLNQQKAKDIWDN